MNIHKETKISIDWNYIEGKFNAEIINGQISELNFCELGQGTDSCGKCLTSIDLKFLQNVHSALGDLFKKLDEARKELGHSYATDAVEQDNKPSINYAD